MYSIRYMYSTDNNNISSGNDDGNARAHERIYDRCVRARLARTHKRVSYNVYDVLLCEFVQRMRIPSP